MIEKGVFGSRVFIKPDFTIGFGIVREFSRRWIGRIKETGVVRNVTRFIVVAIFRVDK